MYQGVALNTFYWPFVLVFGFNGLSKSILGTNGLSEKVNWRAKKVLILHAKLFGVHIYEKMLDFEKCEK